VAVIIGVGFFFKYAIDIELIGKTGRVVIGLLSGMTCFAAGAYAMLRNYRWLSQGLVGAALGILYFSLFAGYQWYQLMPQGVAFGGMVLATAAAMTFAGYFHAQPTAILGLIGGFLTPVMLRTGQDPQWSLFSYILLLDVGVLGLATFRKWQPTQILAFLGTILIWLGWLNVHYEPAKLSSTIILMSAFFVVFALLGVWHNILRRQPALPADFFLILATPVAYFGGLYGLTLSDYSNVQGMLAIGMAGIYLALGLIALSRHPDGRRVVIALGGIAAAFLTIAIPLQLTGHWIVIAWAAESLLLVELGLRFQEVRLRQAGFGLLIFVQMALAYYALGTIENPRSFQTRFQRLDPVADETIPQNVLPSREEPNGDQPSWTSLFNGRSFSFLASAIVLAILAWEYRHRLASDVKELPQGKEAMSDPTRAGPTLFSALWLTIGVPVVLWVMLLVETLAFGVGRGWEFPMLMGMFLIWTSLASLALVVLSIRIGPSAMRIAAQIAFGVLAVILAVTFLGTLTSWNHHWRELNATANGGLWRWFIFNPRGLGFLFAIAAAALSALLYDRADRLPSEADLSFDDAPQDESHDLEERRGQSNLGVILGLFAHLTALALLTSEVYAQGVIRDWGTTKSLLITLVWTLYAVATLMGGIYYRSRSVRVLSLSLFLLTSLKVFLYDVWHLNTAIRFIAFGGLGVSLFFVSFLYRRFRDRIRAWIAPAAIALLIPTFAVINPSNARAEEPKSNLMEVLSHRWPVEISAETPVDGLAEIALPADLYGIARRDLGDLRLLSVAPDHSSWLEVPYALRHRTDETQTVTRPAELLNYSQVGETTQFLLALGDTAKPVNEITLDIDDEDRNYERTVKVFAANQRDAKLWNQLTDKGYLLDVTRPGHRMQVNRVSFPQSRFAYYRIEIHNNDQPPLRVKGATISDRISIQVPRVEFDAQIISRKELKEQKQTQIIIDTNQNGLPTLSLELKLDYDGNFYRPVRLEVTDDLEEPIQWVHATTGQLYRIHRTDIRMAQNRLEYTEHIGRYLRLTVDNGDDQPLGIRDCAVRGIERSLIVEARRFRGDGEIALYAGSNRLQKPTYDLSRTIDRSSNNVYSQLTLKAVEPNPYFTGPLRPKLPWTEDHPVLLWTISLTGIVLLGALTFLLLKKASNQSHP